MNAELLLFGEYPQNFPGQKHIPVGFSKRTEMKTIKVKVNRKGNMYRKYLFVINYYAKSNILVSVRGDFRIVMEIVGNLGVFLI